MCEDASIDTRKTYGQANTEGELPADPNAPLRNMNFGPWFYKGGLFIGAVADGANDASGTARIQLYVDHGDVTDYDLAAVSLFDMGKPSNMTGSMTMGLYLPDSGDGHLDTTESTVKWDTRWDITPGSQGTAPWHEHAYRTASLTDGNSDDYVCLRTLLPGTLNTGHTLTGICLAVVDEPEHPSSTYWHYFASREHEDSDQAFPRNDCAPRVWVSREPAP
jgi:hypothetical protein